MKSCDVPMPWSGNAHIFQSCFCYRNYFIWQDQVVDGLKASKIIGIMMSLLPEVNLLKPERIDEDYL